MRNGQHKLCMDSTGFERGSVPSNRYLCQSRSGAAKASGILGSKEFLLVGSSVGGSSFYMTMNRADGKGPKDRKGDKVPVCNLVVRAAEVNKTAILDSAYF